MKQFPLFSLLVVLGIASEEIAKPSWQSFILNTPIDDLMHLPLTLTKHEIRAIKLQDIVSKLGAMQPCNDLHENNANRADSEEPQERSASSLLSFLLSMPLNTMKMVFMSVDDTIISCIPFHLSICLNQSTDSLIKDCCLPFDEDSSSSTTETKSLSSVTLKTNLMRSIWYTFPHHIVIVQRIDEDLLCNKVISFSMGMGSLESGKSIGESEKTDVEALLSTTSPSSHEAIPEMEAFKTFREVIVYYLALNPPDKHHLYNGENVRLRSSDIGISGTDSAAIITMETLAAHHPHRHSSIFLLQASHVVDGSYFRGVHYVKDINASIAAQITTLILPNFIDLNVRSFDNLISLRRLVLVGHTPVIYIAPEGLSKFIQQRQLQQQPQDSQTQQPTTSSPTIPAHTIIAVHFSAWTFQYTKANNDPLMWSLINHHVYIHNPGTNHAMFWDTIQAIQEDHHGSRQNDVNNDTPQIAEVSEIIGEPRFLEDSEIRGERKDWIFHAVYPRGGPLSLRVFCHYQHTLAASSSSSSSSSFANNASFHILDYHYGSTIVSSIAEQDRCSGINIAGSKSKRALYELLSTSKYFVYLLVLSPSALMHKDTFALAVLEAILLGVRVVTLPVGSLVALYGEPYHLVDFFPIDEYYPSLIPQLSDYTNFTYASVLLEEEFVVQMTSFVQVLDQQDFTEERKRRAKVANEVYSEAKFTSKWLSVLSY